MTYQRGMRIRCDWCGRTAPDWPDRLPNGWETENRPLEALPELAPDLIYHFCSPDHHRAFLAELRGEDMERAS